MNIAAKKRVQRWRKEPLKKISTAYGRITIVRPVDNEMAEDLSRGERLDAVMKAAEENGWL